MAGQQDVDDLQDMLRRNGNAMITQQAAFVQNTLDITLPVEEPDDAEPEMGVRRPVKVKRGMAGVDKVNVDKGGTSGAGTYADGSARPVGGGRPKFSGTKLPVMFSAVVQFNLGEVDIANGEGDGIDDHISTVRAHGSMVNALWARAVNTPRVADPLADVAAIDTSYGVDDVSGLIEGATYEVRLDADDSLVGEFEIETVTDDDLSGTGTVSFLNGAALGFAIVIATMSIYIKGMGDPALAFGSLEDLTDDTLAMYGLTLANFPAGQLHDVAGAWSNPDGKNGVSLLTRRCTPTAWLANPLDRDKIVLAQEDNVRFLVGVGNNSRDPFAQEGLIAEFAGLPVIPCPQAPLGDIVLGDFNFCEFREHVAYAPQKAQGTGPGSWDKASLLPSETVHAYKLPCRGWFSFVSRKRRAFLRYTNVTA